VDLPRDVFIRVEASEPDVSPTLIALAKRAGIDVDEAIIAARVAKDPRYAEEAKSQDEVKVFGRLAYWKVKRSKRSGDKYYVLRFPSGFEAVWRPPSKFLELPLNERVDRLADVVWIEASDANGHFEVDKIRFMRTRADWPAAAKLMKAAAGFAEKHGLTKIGAAFVALHSVPETRGAWLSLALRWALVSLRGSYHFVEWSVKAVLKSTVFSTAESYVKWWHIAGERPSLATLIGDARTGASRLAGVDGVAFDEIGSWRKSRAADDEGFWSALRTGLANCKWKRSKGGSKSIEFERCIPTYWAGNPTDKPLGSGTVPPSEYHRMWLKAQGLDGEELSAMMSRFAGFWGVYEGDVADDLMRGLHYLVPAPGVVRALVEAVRNVQRRIVPPRAPEGLSNRQYVYWPAVYAAVRSVIRDADEAYRVAAGLIRGLLVIKNDGPEVLA